EGRTDQLGRPDAEQFTIQVEDLNAIVLAVGYQQAAAPVIPDAVWQVELSWSFARLSPGELVCAVSRELVHAGIAVAVGHIHVAVRQLDDIGREVEWAAAVRDLLPRDRREIVGWYAGVRPSVFLADGADQLALNGELHELTIMPVRQPDAILRVN